MCLCEWIPTSAGPQGSGVGKDCSTFALNIRCRIFVQAKSGISEQVYSMQLCVFTFVSQPMVSDSARASQVRHRPPACPGRNDRIMTRVVPGFLEMQTRAPRSLPVARTP